MVQAETIEPPMTGTPQCKIMTLGDPIAMNYVIGPPKIE